MHVVVLTAACGRDLEISLPSAYVFCRQVVLDLSHLPVVAPVKLECIH